MDSVVIDSNSPDNTTKARQPLTKDMVETFLNPRRALIPFSDMLKILNMSKIALIRLDKKYLSGELNDLSLYKTADQKKSKTTKGTIFEINLIATEFSHSSCERVSDISEKLKRIYESVNYSQSTICRIVKNMGYTKKSLTLFYY
ncbi:hypothetical protein DMUE_0904 [Dictyocoela muelleri]|nr:hypothetical protein DMUE_0904 [Dictyocoela muelleri]